MQRAAFWISATGIGILAAGVAWFLWGGTPDETPPEAWDAAQEARPAPAVTPAAKPARPRPAVAPGANGGIRVESAVVPPAADEIRGRVEDGAGTGIRNARVHASQAPVNAFADALTDADGRFCLGGLKPGEYEIAVRARGHATQSRANVSAGTDDVVFTLVRNGSIVGRVTNATNGEPVSTYTIALMRRNVSGDYALHRRARVKDGDGRYRFADLEPGRYRLAVEAENLVARGPRDTEVRPALDTGGVDFALRPGGVIDGDVTDGAGATPAGAAVTARRLETDGTPATDTAVRTARVDESGRFRLGGLAGGTYRVTARAPGYCPQSHPPVTVTGAQSIAVSLRVVRGGFLTVAVGDHAGEPLSVTVTWQVTDSEGHDDRGELVASSSGEPEIPLPPGVPRPAASTTFRPSVALAPGEAQVRVSAPGYRTVRQAVTIVGGRDATCRVRMQRTR